MPMSLAARTTPAWLARWRAERTPRERRIVAALVALVIAVIGWLALWQPLERDLAALRTSVPAERAALADARRMAEDMIALGRAPAPRQDSDPRALLERVLAERGLRGAVTQLDWQDERARLVFSDIGIAALVPLLETLGREARLQVVEATLSARVEPGTVRADLVLAR